MKANEFVKEFGWERSKKAIEMSAGDFSRAFDIDNGFIIVRRGELKRLVDSWELVQVALPELKKAMFSDSKDLEYVKNWVLTVSEKLLTEKGVKLKQAIADVESRQ